MASNYSIKDNNGDQSKDIRFSSDKLRLEVFEISSGSTIDSFLLGSYLGMHVDTSNVLWVDDGLSRTNSFVTFQRSSAIIKLTPVGNTFEFIGDDENGFKVQFNGQTGVSIRSDDPKMYFKG